MTGATPGHRPLNGIIRYPLIGLCCLTALGCGPGFDPVARLTGLRVLAIRAQPVNPGTGETTVLDALVYAPTAANDQPFAYSWSWCPVLGTSNDGYACTVTDQQLGQLGADLGVADLPPLTLGTAQTQSFRNPFPAAVLAELCAQGFTGTPADCQDGFPVRIKLTVTHAGARQAATTTLRLPITDGASSNTNPGFDPDVPALGALLAPETTTGTAPPIERPIDSLSAATVTLPRLKETDIRAHVPDAVSESYLGLDDNGTPALVRERLVLSWYVETGNVGADSFHTGYFPGQTDIEQFLSNKWKPGKKADYPSDQAQLIVVLRDNRGGVAWTSGVVSLEPTP